jgi:hypothetical protein
MLVLEAMSKSLVKIWQHSENFAQVDSASTSLSRQKLSKLAVEMASIIAAERRPSFLTSRHARPDTLQWFGKPGSSAYGAARFQRRYGGEM